MINFKIISSCSQFNKNIHFTRYQALISALKTQSTCSILNDQNPLSSEQLVVSECQNNGSIVYHAFDKMSLQKWREINNACPLCRCLLKKVFKLATPLEITDNTSISSDRSTFEDTSYGHLIEEVSYPRSPNIEIPLTTNSVNQEAPRQRRLLGRLFRAIILPFQRRDVIEKIFPPNLLFPPIFFRLPLPPTSRPKI